MANLRFAIDKSSFLYFAKFYILSVICLTHAFDYVEHAITNYSTPEECARSCQDGEAPKRCYYRFHIEFYTTMGPACDREEQLNQCIIADGFERTLISINRQLPGPSIEVCKGDYVIVDVENAASGLGITMHWHGLHLYNSPYYDGVPYITQCPIMPGTKFRYQFTADTSGTHLYHSHTATHMLDGQYGPLIVRDPPSENPYDELYDEDQIILLSDWMHELSMERFPGRYRHDVGQVPENILINGRGNWTDPDTKQTTNADLAVFTVSKGKRYRFRMINSFGTVCLAELSFENHNCTIIAQDGANVKSKVVNSIISSAGERVDFILHANKLPGSYWIHVRGLGECRDKGVQQLAILRYDDSPMPPPTPAPTYNDAPTGVVYNPLDGSNCGSQNTDESVCVNQLESLNDESHVMDTVADVQLKMNFDFFDYTESNNTMLFQTDTYPEFFNAYDRTQLVSRFNEIVFKPPSSPLISSPNGYKTVCQPNEVSNCIEPCTCTQTIGVPYNAVVELVIYDSNQQDDLHHPFHLHGYSFNVFHIGQLSPTTSTVGQADVDKILQEHRQRLLQGQYLNPPLKDTVKIPQGGYAIIRFRADNPGWWLFHCHFISHHITGMELVFHVGEQDDLPPVPEGFPTCYNWLPQSAN